MEISLMKYKFVCRLKVSTEEQTKEMIYYKAVGRRGH